MGGVDIIDWKLVFPWLPLSMESFHSSRILTAEQGSFSFTTTTSFSKCFILRLRCSIMISYVKQDKLRLWNFNFELLWRFCLTNTFLISLSNVYFVFLYMKILERSSFISQQNLSYILQQRICLLFDNILFVAMHYLGWALKIKMCILMDKMCQE